MNLEPFTDETTKSLDADSSMEFSYFGDGSLYVVKGVSIYRFGSANYDVDLQLREGFTITMDSKKNVISATFCQSLSSYMLVPKNSQLIVRATDQNSTSNNIRARIIAGRVL